MVYDAGHIVRLVRTLPMVADRSGDRRTLDSLHAHRAAHHDIDIKRTRLAKILAARGIRSDAPVTETGDDGDRARTR